VNARTRNGDTLNRLFKNNPSCPHFLRAKSAAADQRRQEAQPNKVNIFSRGTLAASSGQR